MTRFETTVNVFDLIETLSNIVGPQKFYLHNAVCGIGWVILNPAAATKTIEIDDDQLAIFLKLKLS